MRQQGRINQAPAARGVIEKHQRLAGQLTPAHLSLIRQLTICGAHQAKRLAQNGLAVQIRMVLRVNHHTKINLATAHAGQYIALNAVQQLQSNARRLLPAQCNALRQQVSGQGGAAGYADLALALRGQTRHLQQAGVKRIQHPHQIALQQSPGIGQLHLACGSVYQLHAQRLLQLRHIAADGRLRQRQLIGRAAEIAVLRHGQKSAQHAQADIHTKKLYKYPINQFLF